MKILVGYIDNGMSSGINRYLFDFAEKNEDINFTFLTRYDPQDIKNTTGKPNYRYLQISRNRHPLKQLREMRRIIKSDSYDAAYFNISESFNSIGILAARLFGVKNIVVHSHAAGSDEENPIKRWLARFANFLFKPLISICADHCLASSDKSAKWLYSSNIYRTGSYDIIWVPINKHNFVKSETVRAKTRKKLNASEDFIIGHVGRFCYVKNQRFILKFFKRVSESIPNSKLLLVGDGNTRSDIINEAKKMGLSSRIVFLSPVKNIGDYIQACDVFVMPSRFEGLSYVTLEAQELGVPCLVSSRISRSVAITRNIRYLRINRATTWAKEIISIARGNKVKPNAKVAKNKSYDAITALTSSSSERVCLVPLLAKALLTIHYVLNITAFLNGFNYLLIPSFALLLLTILIRFPSFFSRKINRLKFFLPLAAFIISYIITFLVSKNYDIPSSVKIFVWTVLHFFFIFDSFYLCSIRSLKKELGCLSKIFIASITAVNIHNLILLLNDASFVRRVYNGHLHRFGISTWGRFYGNYYDPNLASTTCVCAIVLSVYMLRYSKTIVSKAIYLIAILINLFYIYICQSRTGLVSLLIAILIYSVIYILTSKRAALKTIILSSIAIIVFVVIGPKFTIASYNHLYGTLKEPVSIAAAPVPTATAPNSTPSIPAENQPDTKQEADKPERISRKDSKDDITNGRMDIWVGSLEIIKKKPLFGIGFANITQFAKNETPNTAIAKRGMSALHNIFIDSFASQGIVGLTAICSFFLIVLISVIRKLRHFHKASPKPSTLIIPALFACSAAIFAASLLEPMLLYINNLATYLFWLFLGYSLTTLEIYCKAENP